MSCLKKISVQLTFVYFLFALTLQAQSDSQEKRLALVIGNSDYAEGYLKNPINDALLISEALDSLGFDIILDTNIRSRRDFINVIREFGKKRNEYDVAFVYYAGHGIQIGSENFLLPTKELFTNENDVIDYGVSVQNILRYLNEVTDKVNVLVLDACRNNPFERKWDAKRSIEQGKGLAKIPPPTGSLIAFSTEAGTTAEDGLGSNSVYCRSLYENILKPDISLDQVFRNVRSDVLRITNNAQRPIEASQLTGKTYIINPKSNRDLKLNVIDAMINGEFVKAEMLIDSYLLFHQDDFEFFTLKGHLSKLNNKDSIAYLNYSTALKLNPSYFEAIKSTVIFGSNDEDLGILSVAGANGDSIFDYYLTLYPDNYDIMLSHIRHLVFNGEIKGCKLALQEIDDLSRKLQNGLIDTVSIEFGDWDDNHSSTCRRTIQNNMMYIYECLGDYERVNYWATICEQKEPDDPWPHIMLGRSSDALIWMEDNQSHSVDTNSLAEQAIYHYIKAFELLTNDRKLQLGIIEELLGLLAPYVVLDFDIPAVLINQSYDIAVSSSVYVDENIADADYWIADIKWSLAIIEYTRENYFKALNLTALGLSKTEKLEISQYHAIKFHELYTMIYVTMEEYSASCESLYYLYNMLEDPYYDYFSYFYTKEDIIEMVNHEECQ